MSSASSMKKTKAATLPLSLYISDSAASAVPPVASRSSTITTVSPSLMASLCISIVALPYSRS